MSNKNLLSILMLILMVFGGTQLNAQDDVEVVNVVKIGDTGYKSLSDAITAATAGQTITFIENISEDVTLNKSLTIDGANKNYTGTMTVNNVTVTVKNTNFIKGQVNKSKGTGTTAKITVIDCAFDGEGLNVYAMNLAGTNSILIENVTCKSYGLGMLQVPSSATSVVVKNVEISDVKYGLKIDYANAVSLENVIINPSTKYGILNSNYGAKTYTIKNCDISAPIELWERNSTTYTTYKFEGINNVSYLIAKLTKIEGSGAFVATNNGSEFLDVKVNTLAEALPFVENRNYLKLLSDAVLESDQSFNINGNFHLLEKEVIGSADGVLSQSLQLCEFHH